MFFPFFLAIIYFSILFFFGWQLVLYFLKENRIENLIGLSGIFGIGIYVFLINAIGYFIPIRIVFYLIFLLFFIISIVLFYFNRSKSLEWGIDKKWRKILFGVTLLLVIISGLISFRLPLSLGDRLQAGSMPTAATIAEGNFPPIEIWEPERPLVYHYAPELFSAAIHKVSGLPLYLAYDFQNAILIGILFLLGFILVKHFCNNNFKAFVSSLLMLYAGSLVFLKGINGIFSLYNKYILYQYVYAPFKFVFEMIDTVFSKPTLKNMLEIPWNALSFPLMIAVIYLYFYSIGHKQGKKIALLNGFLLALLALSAETYFAVFCLILFIYPFIFGFVNRDWITAKRFLMISFLILVIALPIAFIQGGVLESILRLNPDLSATEYYFTNQIDKVFKINKTPWLLNTRFGEGNWLPIYHPKFLIEWGLLLVLLIPASFFLLRKYSPFSLFLTISLAIFFCIPFLINFIKSCNMERFFYPVNLFGGLMVGLFLGSLYLSVKKIWSKRFILFIIVVLMLQVIVFQALFLFIGYPPGVWDASDKIFVQSNSFEGKAYYWIKRNTNINDYFLILKEEDDDKDFAPNYRFILNTGRIAPIYAYHWQDYQAGNLPSFFETSLFKKIRKSCDFSAIKNLNYNYLYVDNNWPRGFEERCLANSDLTLVFKAEEGDKFVRIYQVKY
jgi:hypothetical protein